jgi:predicted acetyltransferase
MSPARPPRPPALRYRAARRTDVETLAELGTRAYRVRSVEQRREFYTDHPRFGLRDVRVGELDGQVVASLVLYPFTAFVRGHRLPMTGVGSVAVSPEHRRRGVGETLMRAALREMRQSGQALSCLYAFRGSYYRKLGYGVVELVHQLAVSPANLPTSDEARRVRRLMLPDRPAVQALYDRVAERGHLALARRPEWWERRLWTYPGDWVVYEGRRRGQIEGYLYYEVDNTHGPFKLAISLMEFVAATPEAHRGLVGHLATLADQVSEIQHAAPADNSWLAQLATGQNLRPGAEIAVFTDTGGVANGLMLRLTDVKAALEMWPVSSVARGEVALEADDPLLPANARPLRVRASDGRLKVGFESSRAGARSKLPRLRLPADSLGPILAGTLSPARAAECGLAESAGGAAEVIEHWFRARPVFLYQLNGF